MVKYRLTYYKILKISHNLFSNPNMLSIDNWCGDVKPMAIP